MRQIRQRLGHLLILSMIGLLLAACGTPVITPGAAGAIDLTGRPLNIVTTTGHIADAVRNIGGDRVRVTALMGPGVDPHVYKASARDVITIQNADALLYQGLELEGRMTEIFERLAQTKPTYAVSDGVPRERLHPSANYAGAYDPHIWFDPTLWSFTIDAVAERLGTLDPPNATFYADNAARYQAEIAELDRYAEERLRTIPPEARVLITAHDAFGYFGARYDIDVRGLQGISTASEAGAADVQNLADFIAERKIKAIFVESSVPQATIEAVQAAVQARGEDVVIGGQLFSDALGTAGTPESTYIGMFRYNVETIAEALTQ